jgi:hypothetical protein
MTNITFAYRASLFLGPMCWVGGGVSAINASNCGTVEVTSNGRYVDWFFGCSFIGGR